MVKNLFYLFLVLVGTTFYQGKNISEKTKLDYFCDLLAPANVTVTSITHTAATVSWANDPNTSDYILRFRPVGNFPWSSPTVPANQNFYNFNGLMSCTAYEVQVAKFCNNVPGTWSTVVVFNTKLNYCTSESVNSGIMHLSNVTVTPSSTGLSQMISNSLTSLYTDYRPDATRKVYLTWGSANNTISATKTGAVNPNAAFVTVWIDFNANGTFEASEIIMNSTSSSAAVSTNTFSVPSLASVGGNISCAVTMRVIFSNTAVTNGCGTFGYGEVEDYDVYLSTESNLAVSEVNKNREISIYPNPSSDILNISGISIDIEFEIYNAAGQKLSEGKTKNKTVNVAHLVKGVYFIVLKEKENSRFKFIKK
ncbi:GEVED domain-containing protein [Chryseobacterium turcicum]|uniref:GEVED domain-containing protein n=1 Tax=Chryseobacterium turcicum TaxID=2898076 RepID=A0A9Q3YYB4_9FLAO|nr:GEVED domain-containing protein [Chryseobacterium turcicum]MCD1118317.1 GEVED domain-containing protein [Chryseobacterium turcicum]